MIYQRGVFESQAKAIMDYAIPLVNSKYEHLEIAHRIDWNGLADGYPDAFYLLTFETEIKPLAVVWIDANMPKAWFRAMFV